MYCFWVTIIVWTLGGFLIKIKTFRNLEKCLHWLTFSSRQMSLKSLENKSTVTMEAFVSRTETLKGLLHYWSPFYQWPTTAIMTSSIPNCRYSLHYKSSNPRCTASSSIFGVISEQKAKAVNKWQRKDRCTKGSNFSAEKSVIKMSDSDTKNESTDCFLKLNSFKDIAKKRVQKSDQSKQSCQLGYMTQLWIWQEDWFVAGNLVNGNFWKLK